MYTKKTIKKKSYWPKVRVRGKINKKKDKKNNK